MDTPSYCQECGGKKSGHKQPINWDICANNNNVQNKTFKLQKWNEDDGARVANQ